MPLRIAPPVAHTACHYRRVCYSSETAMLASTVWMRAELEPASFDVGADNTNKSWMSLWDAAFSECCGIESRAKKSNRQGR